MSTDEFWQIIDAVHRGSGGDMDRKCELLKEHLSALEPQDLRDFIRHFDAADAAAYSWPLWDAAFIMHGGCSDDSFSDFRATLISLGREAYERALADPESLADLGRDRGEDLCYEGFQYVKQVVAEEKLGEIPARQVKFPDRPAGAESDGETLDQRYPKLAAKYSAGAGGDDPSSTKKPWWKFW